MPHPGTELQPFILDSDEERDSLYPCQGVNIDIPEGRDPYLEWPWKEQAELAMAWDIQVKGGILTVHAPTCLQSTPKADKLCCECESIQWNRRLCRIQDRIHGCIPDTTPYKYLSRLIKMLRQKDNQINTLKLYSLNANRKLNLLGNSNLDHKRLVMAISECNVPCVNHLVQSALRKKHGINKIIRLIGRAMLGTYNPTYTEQEHLISVVLYRLGGARVAEFAHAALGMPGLTTTRKHCMTSIQASSSSPTLEELTSNITAAYQIDAPSSDCVVSLVCMIDEIKVEETLDWCPHTNTVIGLCREHSRADACVFNNIDDAHVMFDDLVNK